MKIHSLRLPNGNRPGFTSAGRLLAVCGAALVGAALSGVIAAPSVQAQSDVGGQSTAGPAARQIAHGDESFRVVSSAEVATAASLDASATDTAVTPVGYGGGCNSCGTSSGGSYGGTGYGTACGQYGSCGDSCGGSCGGYGGACGTRGGGYSPLSGYGNPCAPCDPYCIISFEALYMQRDGKERFSLSPNYVMGEFDMEPGARITIGSVPDCVHGWEMTFTGGFDWDIAGAISDPGGTIQTFLRPGSPLVDADLSAFNDTVVASAQSYSAKLWSVEANRTLVGWDVSKILYGVRYIDYDESYSYLSQNAATQTGAVRSNTDNYLFGFQGGLDLLYPICRHGYTDFRTRLGAFINYAEGEFGVVNNGTVVTAITGDNTDIAGVFEMGLGLRYQVGQMLSVRAGAEMWYIAGVASAGEQFLRVVSPAVRAKPRNRDDFLMTGISLGAELRY